MQEDQNSKLERIALELNKSGLAYLSNQQGPPSAFEYFKKAQKLLQTEIQTDPNNKKAHSLLAVTYNNLAIYYKRTNKPKSALTYLKKALEIQTIVLQDYLATASTHLNICAIYSYMNKHAQAVQHASLSIQMAKKAKQVAKDTPHAQVIEKSCSNIQLASQYNMAVEYQHLKKYQQAIQAYKISRESAKQLGRKSFQTNSQQAIERLQSQMSKNHKKLIQLLQKRKQIQQKGFYQSMRKNKKNYKQELPPSQQTNKYNLYNEAEHKKRTQSVNKIIRLKPLKNNKSSQNLEPLKQQKGKKILGKQVAIQDRPLS